MKTVIIIPARYQSSRLPGKPLVKIAGKEMIVRVWERCVEVVDAIDVYVATDDVRIKKCCDGYGIQTVMTNSSCLTGTDRVYEASQKIEADLYINVQGDEPLIDPQDIRAVIRKAKTEDGSIVNAMCEIKDEKEYRSLTVPKVVARPDGRLLYMSRSPIPGNKQDSFISGKKQVCIYAFNKESLERFYKYGKKTPLESQEDIEILRFIELGYDILMIEVSQSSVAVDVPNDVIRVEKLILSNETI